MFEETECGDEELPPRTKPIYIPRRPIPKPPIQLRLILQLLSAQSRHNKIPAIHFGQRGHVAPEFFELRDGEDIFLAVAPAFLHVFERDVGRETAGEFTDGGSDFVGVG